MGGKRKKIDVIITLEVDSDMPLHVTRDYVYSMEQNNKKAEAFQSISEILGIEVVDEGIYFEDNMM
jgi:hypothetical protein